MHELAIAESIVRIAEGHAGQRQVTAVTVEVGHLRQVVPSSLEFAFELVAAGTVVEGAGLELVEIPAAARCRTCGTESEQPDFPLRCGACGSIDDLEVVRGEELMVESLELDEMLATTSGGRGA